MNQPLAHPWWVRMLRAGGQSRRVLLFWVGAYLVAAVASVLVAFLFEEDPAFGVVVGALFALVGLAHWLTIRWVDRNGSWER
ncbi:hypothetical protein BH23CHL7_BH23CHL7_04240 [soil metagenome]